MGLKVTLQELLAALKARGLNISEDTASWLVLAIAAAVILPVILKAISFFSKGFKAVAGFISRKFYSQDDKDFVRIRNLVIETMAYDVRRLNREANWNDFHYTTLEAEVEVDPAADLLDQYPNRVCSLLITIWSSLKGIIVHPTGHVEKDLTRAITRSRSRTFLIVGDPGSGKTVSLRHLFLRMAESAVNSENKGATIPLYLNLQQLDIPPDSASADTIHDWVVRRLKVGQDRVLHRFLDEHFDSILERGGFFFMFDSFDEIPAVMDAHEEGEVVRQYAKALDDFLHGPHTCRGLVSSRPYRAPKVFLGRRMTIRSLSEKRIKEALQRYLIQERQLARRVWHELLRERQDLLHVIGTPFYLALLVEYIRGQKQLPERQYELFEQFAVKRAKTDEERLRGLGLTPNSLLAGASRMAFAMTATPHVGLQTTQADATDMLGDWQQVRVELLMDALHYSKLGRVSPGEPGEPATFSFVHRRFQEYFAARYLRRYPAAAPIEDILADNRWREVLVLLCEVLPSSQLDQIINISREALLAAIDSPANSPEHCQAIEAMRFLMDGFRSRLGDLPHDIRVLTATFIGAQFSDQKPWRTVLGHLTKSPDDIPGLLHLIKDHLVDPRLSHSIAGSPPHNVDQLIQSIRGQIGTPSKRDLRSLKRLAESPNNREAFTQLIKNRLLPRSVRASLLDQKRAIESVALADKQSAPRLLEIALASDSDWVQETALRSCGVLKSPSRRIEQAIRKRLFRKYWDLSLLSHLSSYTVLFSASVSLRPMLRYARMLCAFTLVQVCLYGLLALDILVTGSPALIASTISVLCMMRLQIQPFVTPKRQPSPGLILLMMLGLVISVSNNSLLWSIEDYPGFLLVSTLLTTTSLLALSAYLVENHPRTIAEWVLLPLAAPIKISRSLAHKLWQVLKRSSARGIIVGIVSLSGIVAFLLGIMALLVWSTTPFEECGFSLSCLYSTYSSGRATLAVLVGLALFGFGASFVYKMLSIVWLLIRDPVTLRYLSTSSAARPSSAQEAIRLLRRFGLDSVKVQYIRALRSWLPSSSEWDVLIEEADAAKGQVRDELYKLAELWQDQQSGTP